MGPLLRISFLLFIRDFFVLSYSRFLKACLSCTDDLYSLTRCSRLSFLLLLESLSLSFANFFVIFS